MNFSAIDKEYLAKQMKQIKFRDPIIFEKTSNAFILLAELLKYYPNLIFKGGTSLLLHIFPPIRFSIDIDIILGTENRESLVKNLEKLVEDSGLFEGVKENIRKSDIPKAHYKFYYNSKFSAKDDYILLDIIFCSSPYYRLTEKNLYEIPLFSIDKEIKVRIPTPEGLFGDKLTAISSKTIGIALNEKREMEFVKQVIDLGVLFDLTSELKDIADTFKNNSKTENNFRKTNYSAEEIISSILDTSLKYSQFLLKGSNNASRVIQHLNDGLKKVSNHLVGKYGQNDLKFSLSKIAYVCNLLRKQSKNEIVKKIDFKLIEGKKLVREYQILESLKKTNPRAYFYWILGYGE